ncbi:AarF domain-containing protein kinase [Sesamum angolense]|uniref:AarF domain-containing protein kinase n=1 Tax=Sesamum angolense TaxID=2727404 RepID=A0AAE1XHC6_9LAMI|nr:AarF domain-containing protein kinase [Sesamum angolense]
MVSLEFDALWPFKLHLRSARRILNLCEANKGFYVKAGQFVAAMRQVPREYSSTLSSLQDQAVPCSFEAVKEVYFQEFGEGFVTDKLLSGYKFLLRAKGFIYLWMNLRFLSFDEKPVAAASIAQVHHAVLKDHQEVAVKVQYPGLEYQMKFDLATMAILSRSVAWLFPEYRFEWMVSEFTKSIASELDFIQEAKNSERAANNFKKNRTVRIPRVYWDFTSRQVLTMQFCEGHKLAAIDVRSLWHLIPPESGIEWLFLVKLVNDLEFLHRMGISPLEVAKALVDVFAEMIFVHGFLHGDPHPGNILVSPQGPIGFSLVILDHGIYKQLSEDFRKTYCRLWRL